MADPLTIGGIVFSAFSAIQQGNVQKDAYDEQARQAEFIGQRNAKIVEDRAAYDSDRLKEDANRERAAGTRRAIEARREKRSTQSRALAVGAASGGGAFDATVENIQGDIGQEGEYNALSELFLGDSAAANLTSAADLTVYDAGIQADNIRYGAASQASNMRFQGRSARHSGYMSAAGTAFSGAGSLYGKYGGSATAGGRHGYGGVNIGGGDRIDWAQPRYTGYS